MGKNHTFHKDGSKWKKSKPDHRLEMRIHGTAYKGNCGVFSAETKDKTGSKRHKDFKFTLILVTSPSGFVPDYHLRSDNKLFIDWKVFHLSSFTPLPVTLNYPFYPW